MPQNARLRTALENRANVARRGTSQVKADAQPDTALNATLAA